MRKPLVGPLETSYCHILPIIFGRASSLRFTQVQCSLHIYYGCNFYNLSISTTNDLRPITEENTNQKI